MELRELVVGDGKFLEIAADTRRSSRDVTCARMHTPPKGTLGQGTHGRYSETNLGHHQNSQSPRFANVPQAATTRPTIPTPQWVGEPLC